MPNSEAAKAIEAVLRRIPDRWETIAVDQLTSTEQRVLRLLVGAGLAEHRATVRIEMAGQAEAFEATIAVTGEAGLLQAIEPVLAETWARWSGALSDWNRSTGAGGRPFRMTKVGGEEWRLTEHGVMARADLDVPLDRRLSPGAAAIVGSRERVINFVLKAGPLAERPIVPGSGRLVALRTVPSGAGIAPAPSTAPMPINLANACEIAAALREALLPMFEAAMRPGAPETTAPAAGPAAPASGMSWQEAMRLAEAHVKKHDGAFPGRNELARIIGCSRATMTKAIKQSPYLKARAAEAKKSGIREMQLKAPIDRAPAGDDSAPRRSDLSANNGNAEPEPLDAYHAGDDEEEDPADTVHKLAAQQRAELMREERQRRRAAKDGKLKE